MNSLLSFLQNHYQTQLDQSLPLGTIPESSDSLWENLSAKEACDTIDWIVQQQWEVQVEYVYESMRYMCSPALTLLHGLVDNGHADVLCKINPTSLSPVNSLIVAHALQVGRNALKVDDARAQNAMLLCLKDGDVDLMANNFTIWMNDPTIADFVVKNLLSRNAPLDGVLTELGEWVFALSRKSMWEPECQPINQWIAALLSNTAFSGVIDEMAAIYERITQEDKANATFFEQKFEQMLSTCSWECAQNYMENAARTASSADVLLPLFPEHFQYRLAQYSVVQNTPNAQQIRERKNIRDAVIIGEAVMGVERKSHAKKI